MTRHLPVCVQRGKPARCPQCGMWVEPQARDTLASYRSIFCWCENWLDISYVDYVIDELGWVG